MSGVANSVLNKPKQVLPNIKEYTVNTTIHGVKYLGAQNRPVAERYFWIITFCISFFILGTFIHELVQKWQERSVILVEDVLPTEIYDIPFPAVTICPQFKINSELYTYENTSKLIRYPSTARLIDSDAKYQYEVALQICDNQWAQLLRIQYTNGFNFSFLSKEHIETLLHITPDIRKIMGPTRYQEDAFQFKTGGGVPSVSMPGFGRLFHTILTNEGVCYTFNLPKEIIKTKNLQTDYVYYNISEEMQGWNYDRGYFDYPSYPRRTWAVGEPYGLISSLFAQVKHLHNDCEPSNLGYKVQIHSPAVYPNLFTNFIPLQHNTRYKIKVSPKISTTSPNLRSYTPEQRQCYFNDERQLQFFKFYNKANCKLECFANHTIAKYGCVHFSIPRTNTTPICGPNIDFEKVYADCENSLSLTSFSKTLKSSANLEKELIAAANITCDCLPECNAIEYEYQIDMYSLPPPKQLHDTLPSVTKTYFHLYFEENSFVGLTRKQLYSFVDLVSNFGGLVGLFIGASILSLFEILYFFIIRQISEFLRKP